MRQSRWILVVAVALMAGAAAGERLGNSWHSRSLKVAPLPVPAPFAFPKDIADAARKASSSSNTDGFAADLCGKLAQQDIQGTREFRDTDGVKLYPMFIAFTRAATVYPDTVPTLAQVLAKCNAMGGLAAEGVGYGIGYVYSKGIVESLGLTQMLDNVYDKAGCQGIDKIMDIGAAVIRARDVALDELHVAMKSYSPKLVACTPKDSQQKFKAYSLRGDVSAVKPKGSRSLEPPEETKGKAPAPAGAGSGGSSNAAGSNRGPAVAMERGRDTAGR